MGFDTWGRSFCAAHHVGAFCDGSTRDGARAPSAVLTMWASSVTATTRFIAAMTADISWIAPPEANPIGVAERLYRLLSLKVRGQPWLKVDFCRCSTAASLMHEFVCALW